MTESGQIGGNIAEMLIIQGFWIKSHLPHEKSPGRKTWAFSCRGGLEPRFKVSSAWKASSVGSAGKRSTGPFSLSASPHLPHGAEIVGNVEKSNVSGVFFFLGIGVTRGNTLSPNKVCSVFSPSCEAKTIMHYIAEVIIEKTGP